MAVVNITLIPNGNQFVRKKLVLNRKRIPNFEILLDNATQLLGSRNCVRLLRTPNKGRRVKNLDSLVNGGLYVALTRPSDKLIKIEYDGRERLPKPPDKPPSKNAITRKILNVQARAFQEGLAEAFRHKNIYIYCNGEDKGMKLHLDKRILINKDKVLQFVSDKLKLRTGAVKSIHKMNGTEIRDVDEIENNGMYVAVGYGQRFQNIRYTMKGMSGLTPRKQAHSKTSSVDSSPGDKTKRKKLKANKERTGNVQSHGSVRLEHENPSHGENDPWLTQLTQTIEKKFDENSVAENSNNCDTELEFKNEEGDISSVVNDFSKKLSIIEESQITEKETNNDSSDENNNNNNDNEPKLRRQGTFEKSGDSIENSGKVVDEFLNNNEIDDEGIGTKSPDDAKNFVQKKKTSIAKNSFEKAVAKNKNKKEKAIVSDAEISDNNSVDENNNSPDGNIYSTTTSFDSNNGDKNSRIEEIISQNSSRNPTPAEDNSQESNKIPHEQKVSHIKENSGDTENQSVENISEEAIEKKKQPNKTPRKNKKSTRKSIIAKGKTENNDEKNEKNHNKKPDSPTVFQASGEQKEEADQVKDSQETQVEKTVDMMQAEQVDTEEITEDIDNSMNRENTLESVVKEVMNK